MRHKPEAEATSANLDRKSRKSKTAEPVILNFTKIRQWYIPADGPTYRALHKLRLPEVRYHEDFFPTLQLITKKKNMRARLVPFRDLYDEFMNRLVATWVANPKRKAVLMAHSMRLESRDIKAAREVFPRVETCLRRFYRRWGFSSEFEYSESPTRAKLVVTFALEKDRLPIIEFKGA